MKKHPFLKQFFFKSMIGSPLSLVTALAIVSLTGCDFGSASGDVEQDRVPDVPASTRATEGAAVVDPMDR